MSVLSLEELEKIIAIRVDSMDSRSYTASLVVRGILYAAQKLGEEAFETVIAALREDKIRLINESADLIYHLMVVWKINGINLENVLNELAKRTTQSGFQEKATRDHD